MGNIYCYDYTHENEGYLRAGLVNASDLQNAQSGTHTKDGITYTLTKTIASPLVIVTITAAAQGLSYTAATFNNALEACGIRAQDLYTGLISHFLNPGDNIRYGFNPDYVSSPYINISQTTVSHGEQSDLAIYYNTAYNFSATQYDPDPTGYTTSDVGTIYIPLRSDNSLGAIGCVRTYCNNRPDNNNDIELTFYYFPDFTTDKYDPSAGETGFKPTGAYTSNNFPGQGGRPSGSPNKKSPDYNGDPITLPGAPDESVASAVGCGFVNCYKIDTANLEKVGQCLYGSTLLGLIQSLSVNPLDFIISLMIFPCSPNIGSSEHIKLGGWVAAAAGGAALGFDASGYRLSTQFKTVSFGSVSIPENWGNFLDYSQTNIELYLPFVGSVSIDVSECMGGTIEVEYTIDFFTGMCVANVLCTRSNFVLPSGKAIKNVHAEHAYQGNCAIQIPLSAINYGSMVGSLINACTQGITNPVAGFSGIVSDAISGGLRPNVSSKGNIVANSGFCSVLYPYVRITRPITAEPESYQEVMGLPSYIDTNLGQCVGLCVCDDIDLKGITGATESELNKIRQYCKDGIYV